MGVRKLWDGDLDVDLYACQAEGVRERMPTTALKDSQKNSRSAYLCQIRVSICRGIIRTSRFFFPPLLSVIRGTRLHKVILQERNALKLRLQLQRVNRCNPGLGQYVILPQHEEMKSI